MEGKRIQITIGDEVIFDRICQDWTVTHKRDHAAAEVVAKSDACVIKMRHPFDPDQDVDPLTQGE